MFAIRVLLICAIALVSVQGMEKPKSNEKCEDPIAHYTELGCRPLYSKRNGRCPERYQCPFMERSTDLKKCYYKSQQYKIGQATGKNVIDHPCAADCVCTEGFEGRASLTCAQVECPDLFEPPKPEGEQCVKQYRLKDCCSYKEICDPIAIKTLPTCEWEGKTYREGEKFYPEGTCTQCICTKRFNGTMKSLKCSKINCGVEIYHGNDVNDMCAPVYLESRPCCPIDWKCYGTDTTIVETAVHKATNVNMKCFFGEKELSIGDKVTIGDNCITCSCSVPPMVTCIRSLGC
ncbi:uncharacterized protein LOC143910601 [Arctopsyche grandis]|uniref:uncharacterized protein LOC143910601 n=1 Tax=Arctopsyche grandis TaxID=121162 RepID=UPI00406D790A